MAEKKFIVAGCGSMARRRIRHALATGGSVAVWDVRPDRMNEVKTLHPELTFLSSAAAMDDVGADAIFICVPPSEHEFYLDWAIRRGVSFMVEQPISDNPHRLDEILREAERQGLITHVSNNQRHFEPILALKRVIDSNEFGPVRAMLAERGEWLPDWHPYEPYQDYYPSSYDRGGGIDAICDLEWVRYLFGDVIEARALARRKSGLDITTDDCADLAMDMSGGPQVMLHCDMLQRTYAFRVKLVCAEGTIVYDGPDDFLKIYSKASDRWDQRHFAVGFSDHNAMQGKPYFAWVEPMYQADSRSFLDRLDATDSDTSSLRDGIENLRITYELIRGSGTYRRG